MPKKTKPTKLTPGVVIISAPFGALSGGFTGSLGKASCSFFNSSVTSTVGGFATFAAVGAIATPLVVMSSLLVNHFIDNSDFLSRHPNAQRFMKDTSTLLLELAAVAAAAAMLGTPVGATVLCMMVIPAACYLLSTLCTAINTCLSSDKEEEDELEGSDRLCLTA